MNEIFRHTFYSRSQGTIQVSNQTVLTMEDIFLESMWWVPVEVLRTLRKARTDQAPHRLSWSTFHNLGVGISTGTKTFGERPEQADNWAKVVRNIFDIENVLNRGQIFLTLNKLNLFHLANSMTMSFKCTCIQSILWHLYNLATNG